MNNTPEIIYTDNDLVVINKPPGISTHGGPGVRGKTVADFLLARFPEIMDVGDHSTISGQAILRPGIVHRLDKDTSGIMVIARTQKSFEELKRLFQGRLVEKIYLAVVCGRLKERRGTISFPIGRVAKNPLKRGVMRGRSRMRGMREAITEYRVLKEGEKYSLLEMFPKTGRMHQLRVHLKAVGHPIACDKIYGGKNVCCPAGVLRQLLHARSLSFSFPEGRKFHFEADPPEDFSNVVKILE